LGGGKQFGNVADSDQAFPENTKAILVVFWAWKHRYVYFWKITENILNSNWKKEDIFSESYTSTTEIFDNHLIAKNNVEKLKNSQAGT
jgi:hypothetical protein